MPSHDSPPTPSNRCAVRICVVLLKAHNHKRIQLSGPEFFAIRDGVFKTRFPTGQRACFGVLWRKHGGLQLARDVDVLDRIPAPVITEMEMMRESA